MLTDIKIEINADGTVDMEAVENGKFNVYLFDNLKKMYKYLKRQYKIKK